MPTESLTSPQVRPIFWRTSSGSDAWVMAAGTEIRLATRSLEEALQIAYLGPEGTFTHLAASQIVLRMVLESGIQHRPGGRLSQKKIGYSARVLAVPLHANV